MPRLRGKSKWGAAWYAAKGRGSKGQGKQARPSSPQDPARASTPKLPIAPTHATTPDLPPRITTPELPQLLSPCAFRVEWFDKHGNSLGFSPRLNLLPPCQPPPPTPLILSAHLSSSSSLLPSSDSLTLSSDLLPPPPPSPVCTRCIGKEVLKDSSAAIK